MWLWCSHVTAGGAKVLELKFFQVWAPPKYNIAFSNSVSTDLSDLTESRMQATPCKRAARLHGVARQDGILVNDKLPPSRNTV